MDPSRIIEMASAFYHSCILFTASDAGIFDVLSRAPGATAGQVAQSCDLDPRGARLLLDAATAINLLVKTGDAYSNSGEAETFLVSSSPGYLGGAIRYNRDVYPAWGKLDAFARSGEPVERPGLHLGDDTDRTRTFVHSMHHRAMAIGRAVVPRIPTDGVHHVLDVGGGPGTYSCLLAQANPDITCTVIDLPGVVAVADELIGEQGMDDRVKTQPGDYHECTFPGEQDLVLFFGMLHQESPESIGDLLRRAFDALVPGGRVCVLDMMTDATRTQPPFSALFAVNMALTTQHGWVFSDAEINAWMSEAGFVDPACAPLPPPMPHWLACARKPQ
jgi:ubiquinone/menaquinone biosynthesis C-methylase UbiE